MRKLRLGIVSQWITGIFFPLCCTFSYAERGPIVASTLDYPPYEYVEDGQAKGIAVDLIREAMHRVGRSDVEFNFYPWKRAVYLTENGQSDILFNAGKNQARQKWGYYVDSVLIQQSYVLFKRSEDDFAVAPDFSDVKDRVIAIRQGYLYGTGPFRQALDGDKFMATSLSDSTEQSVNQLLNERVDLFVGDQLPVQHYIRQQGLEDQIDVILHNGEKLEVLVWPTYILFSKQRTTPEFVALVNEAMESMKQDGSFQRIVQSYQ